MNSKASFLPEDYLDRRLARRSHAVFLTLFAVVILSAVGGFLMLLSEHREVRDRRNEVVTRIQVESEQLETIKKLEAQREAMLRKASLTSTLMDPVQKSNVLAELINHMPLTVSLTDVELDTEVVRPRRAAPSALDRQRAKSRKKDEDAAPPPPPTRRVDLEVTGIAPSDLDVSTYMVSLQTHPLFEEVELLETRQQRVDDLPVRQFRIRLSVDPEMTMADLEPTRRDRGLNVNPLGGAVHIRPANNS